MRLAVVGWCADSGVGRELVDAIRRLPVAAAYVLSNPQKPTRRDLLTVPNRLAAVGDHARQMENFLNEHRPDTILTWEVPGTWEFPDLWRKRGVRWVHVVHWDWFAPAYSHAWRQAAVLVAPNRMCQEELRKCGLASILLPVPVDTSRLQFLRRDKAEKFLSVYAYGGANERRSLREIFAAWEGMADPPPLRILAQKEPSEMQGLRRLPSIEVLLGNAPEPGDLYEEGDVAVQPSRYEGVGVSMIEAQARGIPVIAVDAPPMNEIAPDLLVPVERREKIEIMGKPVISCVPSVEGLRRRVESIRNADIRSLSDRARARAEKEYSWEALHERWLDLLSGKAT